MKNQDNFVEQEKHPSGESGKVGKTTKLNQVRPPVLVRVSFADWQRLMDAVPCSPNLTA